MTNETIETTHLNQLFSKIYTLPWEAEVDLNWDRFTAEVDGRFRFRLERNGRGIISLYFEERRESTDSRFTWSIRTGEKGQLISWYSDLEDGGTADLLRQLFEKANRRRSGFRALEVLHLLGI